MIHERKCLGRVLRVACAAAFALSVSGCVSIYSNTKRFNSLPNVGMTEMDLLQNYGAPDYAGFVEDQKVYVYKIRDSKFVVLLGQYTGKDLIVLAKGGVVKEVRQLPRSQAVTLFYAAPWMGHD